MKFNKYIITICFLLLMSATYSCNHGNAEKSGKIQINDTIPNSEKETYDPKTDTITVIGVGDMMFGSNYPTTPNYLPPNNDYKSLIEPVIDILKDADLTFGNNEGTFSDKPEYAKACNDPEWCYRFSMPEDYVNVYQYGGFDVVSIANNHLQDLGEYGKNNTIKVLKEAGMHFAGLSSIPMDTFTVKGIKYGFCAFAPNDGTCLITDYELLNRTVKKLKSECQIVMVVLKEAITSI
jgi:hypothetical protein